MRLCDWMALAAFWTILVNGDTDKGIPQDNAYGIVPTRYYDTTIHENTVAHSSIPLSALSLLVAPASTTVSSLKSIASKNDMTRFAITVLQQKDLHVVKKLQSKVADESRKFFNSKFFKRNIENEKSSNKLAIPNHSKFDGNSLDKIDSIDSKISSGQFHLKINGNNADSSLAEKTEIRDYTDIVSITEKENTGMIKQSNNVQSDTLQMVGTISSGQNHISEHFNWNKMVIKEQAKDVNILDKVATKIPEDLRKTVQTENERVPIKSWKVKVSDEHFKIANNDAIVPLSLSRPKRMINSSENKNDIRQVQSTLIEHSSQSMTNDLKFSLPLSDTVGVVEINGPDSLGIPILQHQVTTKTIKKSIIQSTTRHAIKNERESKCHRTNTTVITQPLRDTMKKLITPANTSDNHEYPMISAVETTELRTSLEFHPSDIKNKLTKSVPPTLPSKWKQSTGTRITLLSEQTPDTDSTVPSAVIPEIDKPENPQTYIIKSKPNPFVTSAPFKRQGFASWNYDRYAVKAGKVNIAKDLSTVDRLINGAQVLHSEIRDSGIDEIAVWSSSQISRPMIPKLPIYPKVLDKFSKSLRSVRSDDYGTSTVSSSTTITSDSSSSKKYPIDSHYDDSVHDLKFFIESNVTAIVIHDDPITNQPNTSFTQPIDRMSWQTTENASTIIYSDIRILDHSELENSTHVSPNQWPVKHSAVVEGDLVLGGLMMIHEREDTVTCGPVMPQGGVQALEAMLYTLDWLNKREIVPGVKIGAHILDDCDKDTYGLEMAVDFIKGSISNIDGAEYHCNKTAVRKVISGVVGAASSVTSIQVANLLRLFRIPQVSFFSTSPELSNKQRFEYFTRTIPSDHYQVKAMVDIVIKMGWSYISIIYEESNYGIKAYEELEELLSKHQICIAIKEKLVKDSGVADETAYDSIVQKLLTKPRARGCIIFGSDQEVAGVMRAVRRCNATGAFSWIGSDGWSARGLVSNNNEPEVEGTLSVQPQANPVEGFEDYFLNLTVENNRRNPWFVEFWEDHFECRYPNASRTPYNLKHTKPCTTEERLTKQNTAFEDQLQFVSDAVMAFAYAFRDMHAELCRGEFGLCDAMKPTKGTELLKYLRKVEFKGLTGDKFHFDKNGDGPARYNIIHFKQISPGQYKWIRVGQYLEGELSLNMSDIQFRLGNHQPPESVCSLPCRVGQAKKYVEGESCCWHCLDCTQYQIRHAEDQTRCVLCPQGTVPDETHSYCRDIPEEFLKPDSGWAIGAMSFSASGILVTLFVGGIFVKNNDTPIVRASGRELSYVLLTGILLCYLVTFTLVLKPTDMVCGMQRFSAGFCFTVVYAALLTKTNRIARIFKASKKSAKRPSFISPRSQLIICTMLVGVQILINAVWMVIDPAKARHHYPTREDNLLVCNSYIDASYMIAFTYPIILIVVCTVYAVLTRKIPEDFNESKHIGFTMYTTCVIWLAFVPLYFGTGNHVALRITSMSVTISLSASVTIACLFSPKLYIILIHPERNIRRGMGPFRGTAKPTTTGRTNTSSMMATITLTAVTCDQNKAVNKLIVATNDCSTQSEQVEMEAIEKKNGKPPVTLVSRSTQTVLNNNGKEIDTVMSPVIKELNIDETLDSVKSMNNTKIGNGPFNKNELPV